MFELLGEEGYCDAGLSYHLQKGTDLGSITWRNGELVRFFNPRRDSWREHFQLDGAIIRSTTDIGEVTARILDFNDTDRIRPVGK